MDTLCNDCVCNTNKIHKKRVNTLTQNVSNTSTATPGGNLLIGRDPTYNRFIGGSLDQIRIFDVTLTPDQVLQLYNEVVC